jgi:hypothetical protein
MRSIPMPVEDFRKFIQYIVEHMSTEELLHIYGGTTMDSGAYEYNPGIVVIEIYEPGGCDERDIDEFLLKEINNG